MADGPDAFLGAGKGFRVLFSPRSPAVSYAGLATVEEGVYADGQWVPGRRLNGDETDGGKAWRFDWRKLHLEKCTVYKYQ
jgi:beta-galactosidase GanA